ncbi:photosystem reaction center subunit H [Methylobacterium indicum]|uniref:Photosystem reaction center subunit H n=1 Tax=Methylobacterium indicum TaxID=1775910 RepID=A0A0J6RT87_9HYPH|nr:PRC-barrel domain-containing protein [Methylobacterium indicum]KMO23795.1 photosystem reaction center subunit H [Methylobacterium indicum]KMO24427.1 photosystem reaction center subunit H [Methylobacterium indicum]KTS19499.1 photosystem reaction center subunit H [Methylobacterium indicum]KTS37037.1 photosystem reaction center subunit H [Methylobacterium indicum]KTS48019.1 photosystem reaction center subunit H [Methylobacterium indicum]
MPTELPNERALREPGTMELDPSGDGLALDETRRLIASNKVEGTAVYDRKGEHLGSVYNFMVDKVTGQVAYAVLSFGGFLGFGEHHHPVPWKALTYDVRLGGYVIDIDPGTLAEAPRHGPDEDPFTDPAYGGRLDDYYGGRAPTI